MAVRRTKQQSSASQFDASRQVKITPVKYSFSQAQLERSQKRSSSTVPNPTSGRDLFGYDVKLIFKDLQKTLVTTALMIILLIAISWYLRR